MLRGDNAKDEEGHRAVFTAQGASASQMAAAKFLDSNSHLRMAGETGDAISAHTQVQMIEAPRLLRRKNLLKFGSRITPRQRPKSWENIEDPVVLSCVGKKS